MALLTAIAGGMAGGVLLQLIQALIDELRFRRTYRALCRTAQPIEQEDRANETWVEDE